jgi:hypothetical protein
MEAQALGETEVPPTVGVAPEVASDPMPEVDPNDFAAMEQEMLGEEPDTIKNNPQMEVDFWENTKRVFGTAAAGVMNSAMQMPMDIIELSDYIPGIDLDEGDKATIARVRPDKVKFSEKPEGAVPNMLAFGTQFLVPFIAVNKMLKVGKAAKSGEAATFFQKLVGGAEKLGTKVGGEAGGKVGKHAIQGLPAGGITDFVFMTPEDPNFANIIAGHPDVAEGYFKFLATNSDDIGAINRLRRVVTDSLVGAAAVESVMRMALGVLKITGRAASAAGGVLADTKIIGAPAKQARDWFEQTMTSVWDQTKPGRVLDDLATENGLHEPGTYGLAAHMSSRNQIAEVENRILNETFQYTESPMLGGALERNGSSIFEIERKLQKVEAPPLPSGARAPKDQAVLDMWELLKYTQAKAVKQRNLAIGKRAKKQIEALEEAGKTSKITERMRLNAHLYEVSGGIPIKEIDAFFRKHKARPDSYRQTLDAELSSFETMNQNLLHFLKQAGRISAKDIEHFNDVSFLHGSLLRKQMDEGSQIGGRTGNSKATITTAREGLTEADLKSGKVGTVGNIRENTMLGMQAAVREALENVILQKVANTVGKLAPDIRADWLQPLRKGKKKGEKGALVNPLTNKVEVRPSLGDKHKGLMTYMSGGKKKYAVAKDPLLINFVESFGPQHVNLFAKGIGLVGAPFRRVLTFSTTVAPTFSMIKNFTRDSFFIGMLSRVGFVPIVDSLKGLKLNFRSKAIRNLVQHKASELNELVLKEREAMFAKLSATERKSVANQTVKSQWQRDFNQKLQDKLDLRAADEDFPAIDIHDIDNSAIAILKKERNKNGTLKYDMVDVAANYRRSGGAFGRRIYDTVRDSEVVRMSSNDIVPPAKQEADIRRSLRQHGIPEDNYTVISAVHNPSKLMDWAETWTSQFETAGRVQYYAKATRAAEKAKRAKLEDEILRSPGPTPKNAKLQAQIAKLDVEIDKALSDTVAGIESRNVAVDLSNRGTSATATTLISTIPFFNAILQGLTRTAGSLGGKKLLGRNLNSLEREEVQRTYQRLAMGSSVLLTLQAYHEFSEELTGDPQISKIWRGIPEYIRSTNAVIILPQGWLTANEDKNQYRIVTVPLPLDFNIPLVAATMAVDYAFNPAERDIIQKWSLAALWSGMGAGDNASVPQIIRPLVELMQNEKFTGAPIIPDRLAKTDSSDQFKETTGNFYIAAGRALGISPLKLEHVINGFSGTMIQAAMRGADAALKLGVDQMDPGEVGGTLAILQSKATKAERYPDFWDSAVDKAVSIVTRKTSGPGAAYPGSELQQRAYKRMNQINSFRDTLLNYRNALTDPGKFNRAVYNSKLKDKDFQLFMGMYPIASSYMEQIADLNTKIRGLQSGPGDPSGRYQLIDGLMKQKEVIFLKFDDVYTQRYEAHQGMLEKAESPMTLTPEQEFQQQEMEALK